MDDVHEGRPFNLEERTFLFAKSVADYLKPLPRTLANTAYIRQAIRASGSIGANYIEANESLGIKDFGMRIKISRKEAKECVYWLRLIVATNEETYRDEGSKLIREANELRWIFSSILKKRSTNSGS